MIFYCIIRSEDKVKNLDTYKLLQKACSERGIEFVSLEADKLDYSKVYESVVAGSLLYRLAGSDRAALLEALLFDKVTTLRMNMEALLSRAFSWGSAIRLQQADLPIIPTVFNVSKLHDSVLDGYVETLGGFPIILKSSGGSHGAGVMKIDSIESLRSVLDYISEGASNQLTLREFIHEARHLRLVVLGDKVLDAIEYKKQEADFRTNAVSVPEVEKVRVDEAIEKDAINAVAVLGLQFGGVDVLVDEQGRHFIAEVNFPCNFARNQLNTGEDIAGAMLNFLQEKQRHTQV